MIFGFSSFVARILCFDFVYLLAQLTNIRLIFRNIQRYSSIFFRVCVFIRVYSYSYSSSLAVVVVRHSTRLGRLYLISYSCANWHFGDRFFLSSFQSFHCYSLTMFSYFLTPNTPAPSACLYVSISLHIWFSYAGDSMMYQHSVGGGVSCGPGGSPSATTPPNMNSCSSVTPPPLSAQPNSTQNELSGEPMVSLAVTQTTQWK